MTKQKVTTYFKRCPVTICNLHLLTVTSKTKGKQQSSEPINAGNERDPRREEEIERRKRERKKKRKKFA